MNPAQIETILVLGTPRNGEQIKTLVTVTKRGTGSITLMLIAKQGAVKLSLNEEMAGKLASNLAGCLLALKQQQKPNNRTPNK